MTEAQVIEYLRSRIPLHGSQSRLAAAIGVSRQEMCDVLAGRRPPTPQILKSLSLRRVVVYESA